MNVFISWSGERSRAVAEALREWIPMVLQSADVWMSAADMEKGVRWDGEIAERLRNADMGIVCLTPENLAEPWILFEAGAIAKHVSRARVCTYLWGLKPQDVPPPLGLFQHTIASAEDTRRLLDCLNSAQEKGVPEAVIDRLFPVTWPTLKSKLDSIRPSAEGTPAARSVESMVAELLDLNRSRPSQGSIDSVLSKLELIELAIFMLSFRSIGYSQMEKLAFTVLNTSRLRYKGAGNEQMALVQGLWPGIEKIVTDNEVARAAKKQAAADTDQGT